MSPTMRLAALSGALAAALFGPATARSAPEEIQVYMNEMDAPGEVGLDLRNNCVLSGSPIEPPRPLRRSFAENPTDGQLLSIVNNFGILRYWLPDLK